MNSTDKSDVPAATREITEVLKEDVGLQDIKTAIHRLEEEESLAGEVARSKREIDLDFAQQNFRNFRHLTTSISESISLIVRYMDKLREASSGEEGDSAELIAAKRKELLEAGRALHVSINQILFLAEDFYNAAEGKLSEGSDLGLRGDLKKIVEGFGAQRLELKWLLGVMNEMAPADDRIDSCRKDVRMLMGLMDSLLGKVTGLKANSMFVRGVEIPSTSELIDIEGMFDAGTITRSLHVIQ